MEFTINKAQQAVAYCASKDDARPILTNVCIRDGEMIAADGFIMARTKVEGEFTTDHDTLIPAQSILQAKNGKTPINVKQEGERIELSGSNPNIIATTVGTGSFPKVDSLYPQDEPKLTIGMSKEVLSKIVKMMTDGGDMVRFTFYDDSSPIVYNIGNRYGNSTDYMINGLAMPCAIK